MLPLEVLVVFKCGFLFGLGHELLGLCQRLVPLDLLFDVFLGNFDEGVFETVQLDIGLQFWQGLLDLGNQSSHSVDQSNRNQKDELFVGRVTRFGDSFNCDISEEDSLGLPQLLVKLQG